MNIKKTDDSVKKSDDKASSSLNINKTIYQEKLDRENQKRFNPKLAFFLSGLLLLFLIIVFFILPSTVTQYREESNDSSVQKDFTIVKNNESRFVNYINNAQPLTPRKHSLELIPGIGKTYLKVIIDEINKKKFDDYKDLESRAGIKEPVNHLSKRIIEEISGETQFRLFVKK